ncbi:MAG: cytochrome P450 [Alphaproteobacteria bacterium]|nr:cytochrome P450 [Alphaproteobacteria bacterium]
MSTQTTDAPAMPFNLMDREVQQCPYQAYHWLLEHAPVYRDPNTGMVIVTGYDLLREIVKDPKTYSSDLDWIALRPGGVPEKSEALMREKGFDVYPTLSRMDDPIHKSKRSLVDRVFASSRIRKMTPDIDAIAHELIDGFVDAGECEFMRAFAFPLPCIVIAGQIGVPREDIHLFKEWSDASMSRISNMLSDEQDYAATQLLVDSQHYLKSIIDRRRADPRDDIISGLILTPLPEGRLLDDAEIIAMLSEILVGGNETTTSAIGAGMKLMLDRPEVVDRLRAEPGLMKNFVEEVLRLETPIQGLYRVTTRDVTLGGVGLPKGTPINMRWAAGNRDEAVFPEADELDLERRNAGSHVTFGSGIHHCLGATLARVEMASSFTAIIERMQDFRYAEGFEDVTYLPSLLQRTIIELPMTFARRS